MAAGHHDGNETEFHRLKQATPHDLLLHQVHSGATKNMREVSRSRTNNGSHHLEEARNVSINLHVDLHVCQ